MKSTIFTDEKPTEFHLFSSFSWRKKRTKKNLPRSSSNNYTEENGCAYGFVFGKKTKQTKKHDFHQFSPPTRIFAIFSRITIKKKVNKWRWLSVLKKQEKTKTCAKITKYSFLRFTECPNIFWFKIHAIFFPKAFSRIFLVTFNFSPGLLNSQFCLDIW